MTARDVEQPARSLLNDKNSQRWLLADILAGINEGVTSIISMRPDQQLTDENTIGSVTEATALASTLFLPDKWQAALIRYVVYFCLDFRAENQSQRENAAAHYAVYERLVSTT